MSYITRKFDDHLYESVTNKKDNNFYLTCKGHNCLIKETKEAKRVKEKQTVHCGMLKRYNILNVRGEEKRKDPLFLENIGILYFVTLDKLFNIIHDSHIAVGHGGRTQMIKELNCKYKNVTIESTDMYLRLCESCQGKISKKGNCSQANSTY